MNYYRLKQVDFNNDYYYSKVITINFESNSIEALKNIYVDKNSIYIQLNKNDINNLLVEIYDESGRQVFNENLIQPTEFNFVTLPKNITSGIYFLKIYNTDFNFSKTINISY